MKIQNLIEDENKNLSIQSELQRVFFEDTETVLTEINPQKDHRSSQTKQVTDSIKNRV